MALLYATERHGLSRKPALAQSLSEEATVGSRMSSNNRFLLMRLVMHTEFSPAAMPLTVKPDPDALESESSASRPDIGSVQAESDRATAAAAIDEAEILQASIKAGSVAQIVIAAIAVIGLIYLLKLVMVTTLFSILLAFVLEPLVGQLCRIRVPRAAGALLAVSLMVGMAGGLTYFFYGRAVDFATQLPKYSGKIRLAVADLREQTNRIEDSARAVMPHPTPGRHHWRSRFGNPQACRG